MRKPDILRQFSHFLAYMRGRAAAPALAALLAALPLPSGAADSTSAVERAVLADELADYGRIHKDALVLAAAARLSRLSGRSMAADDPYAPDRIFDEAKAYANGDRTSMALVLLAEADVTRHPTSVLGTHFTGRLKRGDKPLEIALDCKPSETMIADVRQIQDDGSPALSDPYPLAMSVKGPKGAPITIARNRETLQAVWTPPAGGVTRYVVEIRGLSKNAVMVDFNAD